MKEIFAKHVSRDQLIYGVNNSKLAQPSKVPLTKTLLIRHNVTCKSSCAIYQMERSLCKKSEYVGKSEQS